ncbi:MAG TPA: ATP F0F1 synthase subunit B [Thermohalobaculum sp.]|nr:ATP F0F1 synthase subunit B [Thermohalobaculum sp.]
MAIFHDSWFVVGVALIIFLGILGYFRVHELILGLLDKRADRIREELDEVRRLREEAQATFAQFERKRREVDAQTQEIIDRAEREAEQAGEKAKTDLEASIERRLRQAEEQIEMAEAKALREVRNRAVEVAVAAAGEVIASRMPDEKADALVEDAIKRLGDQLH